ncbi:MAG: alpha/beta fold hydrolase [Gammaproteobacteria bacterium]|nr:alpha/beta fold hydrolase [Gammaproteobacteria bacterium]MCP5200044.1 alpha/beta fold hydrolase [Gammaproteobacteria bacterium]
MSEIRPFRFEIPEQALQDLQRRLTDARWPEQETVDDWSQGAPLAYVQEVCEYWRTDYDWRRCEAALNALPQFITEIDGLDIQFIHLRSKHADALPMVMTHGWPGSVIEFMKVLGPLTDPTAHGGNAGDAFHVVCPTLPGFGFSGKPRQPGWGIERIGRAWGQLMARLGYDRYVAQGGDWGSAVTHAMGLSETEHCAAMHTNMPLLSPSEAVMKDLTEQEQSALAGFQHYFDWDSGYSKEQSTRPQTVGYGLVDSPVGQCAWILEKFWAWTDSDGHPENVLSRDEMLDNIMLYWLPGAAASSARLYWESFSVLMAEKPPIVMPAGASVFPHEIFRASRRWCEERYQNLIHYNTLPKGGHFAAFEQPESFVDEVRTCFRQVR